MSTMAKTPSKSEAALNAYQCSPQYTTTIDSKMTRLEERMEQLMKMVGNRPQESTGPKIAAYQPITTQSADEELRRLREENRFLRTSQRGPEQPQQFQNRMNYDSRDAFQERMMNEMRRMQARLDGFMRTHANRNNRQEQPRVWTREGLPVCDICGRRGHVRQNCYARVDQRNQYQNPQNTQPHTQTGPRIATLEAEGTAEPVVAQFNQPDHQQKEKETQSEGVYYARRSNPPIFGSTEVPRISTIQEEE